MNIVETSVFLPGNIHTRRRAIQLRIEGAADVTVPPEALRQLAQTMAKLRPQVTDFPAWRRVQGATGPVPVAAIVEVMAIVAQRYSYWPVKFCAWRESPATHSPDQAGQLERQGYAVYETGSEGPGRAAAAVALGVARAVLSGASSRDIHKDLRRGMRTYLRETEPETPSGDSLQIAGVAASRGIPWSVLHESTYLRLGWGAHSHVMRGSESTNTGSINRALARNKGMTNRILAQAGLPVAEQRQARDLNDAAKLAEEIGYPLVVKPRDGNMGKGVTVGVTDRAELELAVTRALKVSKRLVLERFIAGDEYRLLVINGEMVAAVFRRAAQVVGDGSLTVRDLVKRENQRPERDSLLRGRMAIMSELKLDRDAIDLLTKQGLTVDSVPGADQVVYLRRESNVSRGGEAIDVTSSLHPDNKAMAARAAAVIGLDVCGVDFITPDPSVPWHENGGTICEVNSRPGINMQIQLGGEIGQRIPLAVLSMLFPKGTPSRMPVVALLGLPEQTASLRKVVEELALAAGRKLAVLPSGASDPTLPSTLCLDSIEQLEWDTDIEVVLLEATPDSVLSQGLGVDRLDLAVIAMGDGSAGHDMASHVLRHLAGPRVAALDDPAALARIAQTLGLSVADMDQQVLDDPAPHALPVARKPVDGKTFTATFLGDIGFGESYMHRRRATDLQRILGTQGHGYSLVDLHGILGLGDLNIANLETPLSGRPDIGLQGRKKYLGWSDPDRTVAALQQAGIDAVCLANNHALDCGQTGLSETLTRLDRARITGFGAGPHAEAAGHPLIHRFTAGGIDRSLVVFPGFEFRGRYDSRYRWYAKSGRAGVAVISADQIARQIALLRDILPDPTFVAFPHWGTDYTQTNDRQVAYAGELAAAGIDLIIGHGAHVAQPFQMVDGCPVLFNLGNFVWNTPGRFGGTEAMPYGAAATLTFTRAQKAGPRLRIYPLVVDNMLTQFQNRPVTEAEFEAAADLIGGQMRRPPRRMRDDVGHYLDIPLRRRTRPAIVKQQMAAE